MHDLFSSSFYSSAVSWLVDGLVGWLVSRFVKATFTLP